MPAKGEKRMEARLVPGFFCIIVETENFGHAKVNALYATGNDV